MAAVPSAAQCPRRPRWPENSIDFANPSARRAWEVAWSLLLSFPQADGLAALLPGRQHMVPRSIQTVLLAKRASVDLPLLIASTRTFSVVDTLAAAVPLIGAGPGLTPSWDDLLIGYMCGLRATSAGDLNRASFLDRIGGAICLASAHTTAVSRFYIERTAQGYGPNWIETVLSAISRGDCDLTNRSTREALHVGRTSGTDMMFGAVLGTLVWQSEAQGQGFRILSAILCGDQRVPSARLVGHHGTN